MRTRLGIRREGVNLERYGWNERFRSLFESTTNGDLVPARVIRVDREAVNTVFPQIDEAAQGCRYGDCRHEAEPGCADSTTRGAANCAENRGRSYMNC